MPIKIPDKLPAAKTLKDERIFVMTEKRASSQDIRPLKIAILNIMPTKIVTETQLLRLLGNSPIQVDVDLLKTKTYESKNTAKAHLQTFYRTFDQIKDQLFDGLIITGAPVEHLEFEDVAYWDELKQIMDWSETNVFTTFYICWAAQAGVYYHYGVKKHPLPKKMFGIFEHEVLQPRHKLLRGFDDIFWAPHSRHTALDESDIRAIPELEVLCTSKEAGVYLFASKDGRHVFVTGHSEYDPFTLDAEYKRDVQAGKPIEIPCNYYQNDDPDQAPMVRWRSHGNLLYGNWLNYFVYQETPYEIQSIAEQKQRSRTQMNTEL